MRSVLISRRTSIGELSRSRDGRLTESILLRVAEVIGSRRGARKVTVAKTTVSRRSDHGRERWLRSRR